MNKTLKDMKIVFKKASYFSSERLPDRLKERKLLGITALASPEILFNSTGTVKLTDFYKRMLSMSPQLKTQLGSCLRCDNEILRLRGKHFCRSCAQEMRRIKCHVRCGFCGKDFTMPLHQFRTWLRHNFEEVFCKEECSAKNKTVVAKLRKKNAIRNQATARTLRSSIKHYLNDKIILGPSDDLITDNLRRWPEQMLPKGITKHHLRSIVSRLHPSLRFANGTYEPHVRPMLESYIGLCGLEQKFYRNCVICRSIWLGGRKTLRPSACGACQKKIRVMLCEVACGACGRVVILRYSDLLLKDKNKKSVFCDKSCAGSAAVKPVPACAICKKKCRSRKNKYCSAECAHIANRKHLGEEVECLNCKALFIQRSRASRTCSVECAKRYRKMLTLDPLNITRMNYYSYSGHAKKMMGLIVKRENNLCALCSLETRYKNNGGRSHEVHHIDKNKDNNAPANLIYLCKRCHTSAHHSPNEKRYSKNHLCALAIKLTAESNADLLRKIVTLQIEQAQADILHATGRLSQLRAMLKLNQAAGAVSLSS